MNKFLYALYLTEEQKLDRQRLTDTVKQSFICQKNESLTTIDQYHFNYYFI